jgi:demethylmenaquinone methyltransferase/2-methoxy-6-polyprenyl-1,4-benzoquinol methylase
MVSMHGDVGRFDRFARAYDLVMPRARVGKLQAGLAVADREITRALDVGGGPGRATRRLDVPERIVVDAAPGMLRQAREYGLSTVAGDATRLPVRSGAVDAVFVVDALHHIQDVDDVFAEARRVLRPGGVLVVREFDPTTVRGRGLVLAERLVGFDSAFYTPETLGDAMSAAGLAPTVVERGFGYTVAGVRENERTK